MDNEPRYPGRGASEIAHALLYAVAIACALLMVWLSTAPLAGQSLTIGGGELRSGQFHRQDVLEVEASWRADRWLASATASFRHGENDHDNRPWPPFLALAAGPRVGPLALTAGMQSYPWAVARWTPLVGPRLDVALGSRVRLHVSHLWRRDGLVEDRMGRWTGATRYRLDLRL